MSTPMNIDYMRIKNLLDEITDPAYQFSDELVEVTVDNIHHLTQSLFELLADFTLDSESENIEGWIRGTVDMLYDRMVANIRDTEDDDIDVMVNLLATYIDDGLVTVPHDRINDTPRDIADDPVVDDAPEMVMTSRDILERLLESLESYASDRDENMKILRIQTDRAEKAREILRANGTTISGNRATGIYARYINAILRFESLIDDMTVVQYTSHVPIHAMRQMIHIINNMVYQALTMNRKSTTTNIFHESHSEQRRKQLYGRNTIISDMLRRQLELPTDDESLKSLFVSEKIDDPPTTKLRSDIESLLNDVRNLGH